jgi:hypothetical protein
VLAAAVLFFVVAALLFAGATAVVGRTYLVLKRGMTTYGTVVGPDDLEETTPRTRRLVEYNILSGEKLTIPCSTGLRSRRPQPGDRMPVVFDPHRPGRHRILSFADLWSVPLRISALGVLFAVLGLIALTWAP